MRKIEWSYMDPTFNSFLYIDRDGLLAQVVDAVAVRTSIRRAIEQAPFEDEENPDRYPALLLWLLDQQ